MIRVAVKPLREALRAIERVVERRNTIPILSNVKLSASTRELRLTATDMDVQLERRIVVEGDATLAITVSAATLAGIAGKLPQEETATLALDKKGSLALTCARARFSLPTLPVDDFPEMVAIDDATTFDLPAPALLRLIETVRFACSTEETRYYLNGIYFHVTDGQLRAVATDGHRLARVQIDAPDDREGLAGAIVGNKAIDVLRQLLDKVEDSVGVAFSRTKLRVAIGDDVLTAKLIDGTFPDYTRVIPQANAKRLVIDRATLATAVDRVAVISAEKTRAVKLDLQRDVLALSVSSAENGTASEECGCDYAAAPLTIGFNSKYLLDVLRHLDGDTIQIMLDDPASPTLLRPDESAQALFVLMPFRV